MALIIPTYWKAVDGVSAVMRAMGNSTANFAAKAEASIQRADRAVNKYTSILSHAQKELLQTVSVAAIAYKGIEAIEYGFDAVKEYDEAITKLQTNFRLSDAALVPFKKGIMDVAKESYKSASEISEVFNVIGSNNRELLKNPEALAAVAKSSVTLSEALKTELIPTTQALSGVMKTFNLTDSAKTIDVIAAASSSGNVKGLELSQALSAVGLSAKSAHVSLSQAAAAIEFIDSKAALGAESGGAFQKMLLKMQQQGLSFKGAGGKFDFTVALQNMTHYYNRMNEFQRNMFLKETFGNKNIDKARSFFQPGAIEQFKEYQKKAEEVGIAEEMAAKNTATLAVAMERVKGAFANAFIESDTLGTGMNHLKNALVFVYEHMDTILNVVIKLIEAFLFWKTVVIASTIVTGAYNIAIGVMGAVTGIANIAIGESTLALGAYKIASLFAAPAIEGVTVANTAMAASFTSMLGPIALVALALAGLYEIEKIGSQKLAEYAENKLFKNAPPLLINTAHGVEALNEATKKYQLTTYKPEVPISGAPFLSDKEIQQVEKTGQYQPVNSKLAQQTALTKSITETQKQNVSVTFDNMPKGANVTTDNDLVKIVTSSTHGYGFAGY